VNRTVLLVDENLDLLGKMATFLEDFGYLVQIAPLRKECLGKIKAFNPGLIITRLQLPDGDALTMATDIREFYDSEAPVIVMASAKEIDFYRRKPEAKTVQDWIRWPIENMDLYNKVSEWLGKTVDPDQLSVAGEAKPSTRKPRPPKPQASKPIDHPKPGPAEVIGNLTRTPVARLLRHLAGRHDTGVLTLNHPPRRVQVHLENGIIVNVSSNYIPDLSLGIMMAKKGEIAPNELSGARKRWQRTGGLFGQILLSMQLVKESVLHKTLLEQRLKKVISLFDWHWRSGTFRFERDPNLVEPAQEFRLRVEPAVIEGIRSCYDRERLMMVFGKNHRLSAPVKLAVTDASEILGQMSSEDLQNVIDAIRTGHSLKQAILVAGMDELQVLQYAYALYVLDLLTFVEKQKSPR